MAEVDKLLSSPASPLSGIPSLTGGGAGPSTAAGRGQSAFDSSGWNVNFGGGSISSNASSGLSAYLPYVLAAAAVVIAWRMSKKR